MPTVQLHKNMQLYYGLRKKFDIYFKKKFLQLHLMCTHRQTICYDNFRLQLILQLNENKMFRHRRNKK